MPIFIQRLGLAAMAQRTRVTSYGQVTSPGHSQILFVQQA